MTKQVVKIIDKVNEYVFIFTTEEGTKTYIALCDGIFTDTIEQVKNDIVGNYHSINGIEGIKVTKSRTIKKVYHFPVNAIKFPDDVNRYLTGLVE